MEPIVLTVHIVLAIVIIVLVLLQQGTGASIGASFGSGSSNTVFGSQGSVSFFTKLTSWALAVFFITSLVLAWIAQQQYYGQASDVNQLLETMQQNATSGEVLPGEQQPEFPIEDSSTTADPDRQNSSQPAEPTIQLPDTNQ